MKPWNGLPGLALMVLLVCGASAQAPAFAVATIRLSAAGVNFESDGETQMTPTTLHMRDVTIDSCIKWAYDVQEAQVAGPDLLRSERYDILAKADAPTTDEQMRLMLRQLLADRFQLTFHRESREMRALALIATHPGNKLHESAPGTQTVRQNTASSTIAKALTMQEFADFLAGPLKTPVVDQTNLKGRYDFVLDFTSYLPVGERPNESSVLNILQAALQGELGLKLEKEAKTPIEVMVIDRVEKPSPN
jgi:uncharacterized protein (TIGR03435 family)